MARRRRALVVAVAVIAGAGYATAGASAPHPAASAAGATPPAATAAAAYDWTRSPAAALDLGGGPTSTLSAVIAPQAAGEDWLIAGTRLAAGGATTATVWSSPDGSRWTSAALPGTDGEALAAAAWGTRTVVVGSVGEGATERAAVWITAGPDQPFTLVPAQAATSPTAGAPPPGPSASVAAGSARMDVVAAGAQGVFAAGAVSGRQALWYSTDGTDWVRLAGAERLIDGAGGADVTSMLVTPGAVVAAGTVRAGTQIEGAIWTSTDGIAWRRFSAPNDPFVGPGDHRIDGLAVDSTGSLIAVGGVRSGPAWLPASWISPNGGTWSQASEALPASTRPQPGQGGAVVRAVAAPPNEPGLVAVGGSASAQRIWTSTDGQNWTEADLPAAAAAAPDLSADLVAVGGSTTVVVDRAPGQPRVLVRRRGAWQEVTAAQSGFGPARPVATPAALVDDGGLLVLAVDVARPGPAIGQTAESVVVLASRDGTHWRRLSDVGSMSGARVDAMEVIAGSLVAVGSSTTPAGGSAATVWTSSTGRTWEVAGVFGRTTPAPKAATAVTALGPTVIAAGRAPLPTAAPSGVDATPAAQAWSSTGSGWQPAGLLDMVPTIAAEEPLGACSNARTAVVVGTATRQGIPRTAGSPPPGRPGVTTTTEAESGTLTGPDGQGSDGTTARTWATTGVAWTAGTVSPLSGVGGAEAMDGCAAVGSGFVAWGRTPGPGGEAAALWSSPDGVTWTLEAVPTLTAAGAGALSDLAVSGPQWVSVSGGDPAATIDPVDPTATVDNPVLPAAAPVAASGPDGPAGVWSSGDAGLTWTRVGTAGAPWAAGGELTTDLVRILGPAGSEAGAILVVGQVDGRLAVWRGTPPAGSPAAAPTTAGP